MAGNSLSFRIAFNLHLLGGPKFTNLTLFLQSCMLRSANKTFTGHNAQHRQLLALSEEHNRLANFGSPISAIPPGWDSPAFCSNLSLVDSLVGGALPPPPGRLRDRSAKGGSLQARYYGRLVELQPDPTDAWIHLLVDRASMVIKESPCFAWGFFPFDAYGACRAHPRLDAVS